MTFLLDENLSFRTANALKALEKPVVHVTEILEAGSTDEEIFEELSQRGWFLLTQDQKIRRRRHQREAMMQQGLGVFVLTGRAVKSLDDLTIMVLEHFDEIERLARDTRTPFIFGIPDRGRVARLD